MKDEVKAVGIPSSFILPPSSFALTSGRVLASARFVSRRLSTQLLRADLPLNARTLTVVVCVAVMLALAASSARAQQQTNPVDRKVENPITDTPSVNPLSQDRPPIRPRPRRTTQTQG